MKSPDEKIGALRGLMKKHDLSAYIIPTSDPHNSEYVPERFKSRKWISGFTGSAGTVVVTEEEAGLWTDGRYHIQAEKELKGTEIELFKMGKEDVPSYKEWLADNIDENEKIGFNGKLLTIDAVSDLEDEFTEEIELVTDIDLVDEIWKDRPQISKNDIFIHEVEFAGKDRREKIEDIMEKMEEKDSDVFLITKLDEVAWTFNMRGDDIEYNPVAVSYGLISNDGAHLFIDPEKVPEQVKKQLLDDDIVLHDYEEIEDRLSKLQEEKIIVDHKNTNKWIFDLIPEETEKIEENPSITQNLKAVKNETEIENYKECQIRDGVAMVRFLYWLENNVGSEKITEITTEEKVEESRSEQDRFVGPSFDPIAAYKDHAPMMHYSADEDSDYELDEEGFYLLDSGAHYFDGTTDITRTVALGELSEKQKRDFTLVLKGHINLATARFLKGTRGANLDVLARKPMWDNHIDYKSGTGHGVGYFLNVHEGPQNISNNVHDVKLKEGMVITNEPGIYRKDEWGIRTENTLLVVKDEETDFGEFFKFETISLCPIDLDAIDTSLLTKEEKEWLNEYHDEVYRKLSPRLNEERKEWLKEKTRKV
ncbi:MAG: aminopeptidase P family protein [Candidatus Thermoplasmatota archaeon]